MFLSRGKLVFLFGLLSSCILFQQIASEKKNELAIPNVAPNVTFGFTLEGPDGCKDAVNLVLHTKYGKGVLVGDLIGFYDGDSPVSHVVFADLSVTSIGIYSVNVTRVGHSVRHPDVISNEFKVLPLRQCNGKLWNETSTCSSCVSPIAFKCTYCQTLETCVDGDWKGPLDKAACPDFNMNVCFVKNYVPFYIVGGGVALLLLLLFLICCCSCRRRRKRDRDRVFDDYDRKYNFKSPSRNYSSNQNNQASDEATESHRRDMEAKYGISSNTYSASNSRTPLLQNK